MMLKRCLAAAVLLFYCFYSYSETIYSSVSQQDAFSWTMYNLLPQQAGLTVQTVTYSYSVTKPQSSDFIVKLEHKFADGSGSLFKALDNWTGLPSNSITKTVVAPDVQGLKWGSGSFTTTGQGSMYDPKVRYSYRLDTCAQIPVTDPQCPGYVPKLPEIPGITDPLDDPHIQEVLSRKYTESGEQKPAATPPGKTSQKTATVPALAIDPLQTEFFALNNLPVSYTKSIPGGSYPESIKYADKPLQDNKLVKRLNFSQEKLHSDMVNQQYLRKVSKGATND